MCQPKRWLWGLLPLAVLWLLAGMFRNDPIQTDLTQKSAEQALKTGAPWAKATFEGRDATLSGMSATAAGQKLAADAIDSIPGVRLVKNASTVLADAKPYTWSAARDGAKVTLAGFIPDEATRAKIIDDTKKAVPSAEITDQMKLAGGVPALFGAATTYSMAQLARLPNGKANLSDATLNVTGTAPSLDIFQMATAAGLPTGLAGSVKVDLPTVKPYVWQAQKSGPTITLTGLAPSAEAKAKIADAAKTAAPNATIVDQMRLANGAPVGFEGMATAAFGHLARVSTGIASLADANYTVTGAAPSVENFNAVTAAAKALPTGFTLARADITAPTINPYSWSATRNGSAITLSGFVPDEATKAANVVAARAAVPNALLTDQQTLGAGAPNGFAGMAAYAIGQLGRLSSGTASLSNMAYAITGAAPTSAVKDQTAAATATLPAGFTLARQEITAPAAPAPAPVPAPVPVPVIAPVVVPPTPVVVAPPPPPPLPVVPVPAPVVVAPPVVAPVVVAPPVVDTCQVQFNALLNEPILFDTNKDTIRSVSYIVLGRLAAVAKTCPTRTVEIGAHTDTDGTPAYNQDLSERRAQAVVEYLVREGVAGTMLKPAGFGETKPIAPNDTAENKQKNRRVEFVVK
jgi:OmpA-OmpF porin, OOP family